jgi:hypothetical protein
LSIVATVSSVAIGAAVQPIMSLIAMVAVVDAMALLTTVRAALATAVVCWCLHSGFVLGRHGELVFTPQSGHDALVLLLVTLSALGFASILRAAREHRDAALQRIPTQRQGDSVAPSLR